MTLNVFIHSFPLKKILFFFFSLKALNNRAWAELIGLWNWLFLYFFSLALTAPGLVHSPLSSPHQSLLLWKAFLPSVRQTWALLVEMNYA